MGTVFVVMATVVSCGEGWVVGAMKVSQSAKCSVAPSSQRGSGSTRTSERLATIMLDHHCDELGS
jgi:hypothetical protein